MPQDQTPVESRRPDVLGILLRGRRFVFRFTFLLIVFAVVLTLLRQEPFESTAVIIPWANTPNLMPSLVNGISDPYGLLDFGSKAAPRELYSSLLESRGLAERVAARLRYHEFLPPSPEGPDKRRSLAVEAIQNSVSIEEENIPFYISQQPPITIRALNHDPVLAADIANAFVFELDRMVSQTSIGSASRLRQFVEERLANVNVELEEAQRKLRAFEERYGAVSVPEQAEATLTALSDLEAQRVVAEIELRAQEEALTPSHSAVRALRARLDAIEENINRLTYSQTDSVSITRDGRVNFYLPLARLPELGFDSGRLQLQLKIREGIVSLLTSQLEQAKIEEQRNLPSITSIDPAIQGKRNRLYRLVVNVVLAGVGGLLGGVLFVFVGFYVRQDREKSPADSRVGELTAALKEDLSLAQAPLRWLRAISRGILATLTRAQDRSDN